MMENILVVVDDAALYARAAQAICINFHSVQTANDDRFPYSTILLLLLLLVCSARSLRVRCSCLTQKKKKKKKKRDKFRWLSCITQSSCRSHFVSTKLKWHRMVVGCQKQNEYRCLPICIIIIYIPFHKRMFACLLVTHTHKYQNLLIGCIPRSATLHSKWLVLTVTSSTRYFPVSVFVSQMFRYNGNL